MHSIIILAAGKGTRMKTKMPKCVFPLLDKPLILYLISTLKELDNCYKPLCVVGYQKEALQEVLKDEVNYVFQEEQLGTADAVLKCEKEVQDADFSLIINGDTPLLTSEYLNALIDKHLKEKNDLTLLTTYLVNPQGYGRIIKDNKFKIKKIAEEKDLSKKEFGINEVNLGVYVINNDKLFDALKRINNLNNSHEYYLTDIVKLFYEQKYKISCLNVEDNFHLHGINDLITLSEIENKLKEEINNKALKNGVYLINKDSIILGTDVKIDEGSIIYPNTLILGKCQIGKNCVIGPNCEINDSIIEDNVKIKHSLINNSYIKKGATIGPFAHLRMNAIIGENDRIGNFVEIKKSLIGKATNVAHLTYIGDTTCGDNVNFGCGVITVNYDGINKHHTTIGNNVFIGCNSNLIAPLNIGDNVFIAAGSTITTSLEKNDFSIARAFQVTKKNYSPKYKYNTR